MSAKMTLFENLATAAWLAAAGLAAAHTAGLPEFYYTLCLFKNLTGWPCPGCGMGHAILDAFRGRWIASLSSHPLGIPFLALWTTWLAFGARNLLRGRLFGIGLPGLRPFAAWLALGVVFSVYLARI